MSYTTFNKNKVNHLIEPMFFGESVGIARYDQVRFPWIDKHTDKQLSFFWRPEEIDLSNDRSEFNELEQHEMDIFTSNLKYQILLDSVQGRSPNIALLPLVSLPELETWIETWSFSETIHSRSYTHIIRNIYNNPSEVFDHIIDMPEIVERAESVTADYDELIRLTTLRNSKKSWSSAEQFALEDSLFKTMVSVNVLEGVRFYVSFACSYAFAERKLMEGNAKVIKLINRDEQLHLSVTQQIIQHWINGKDNQAMQDCAIRNFNFIEQCFRDACEQEKEWANYLFKDGSMIGLNTEILCQYIEYLTDMRIKAIGLSPIYNAKTNPLPWITAWTNSDNMQVAPQEVQLTSYLTGALDSGVNTSDFNGLSL